MSGDFEWQIATSGYSAAGLRLRWIENCQLRVGQVGQEVVVQGNAAGLETLARHLLTLAQQGVPSGMHVHLDDENGLEPGSLGIVLERADEKAEEE